MIAWRDENALSRAVRILGIARARRTMKAIHGMPATPYVEPWKHLSGCCVTDEKWICSKCRHTW
jgi:hypothetical protein